MYSEIQFKKKEKKIRQSKPKNAISSDKKAILNVAPLFCATQT